MLFCRLVLVISVNIVSPQHRAERHLETVNLETTTTTSGFVLHPELSAQRDPPRPSEFRVQEAPRMLVVGGRLTQRSIDADPIYN